MSDISEALEHDLQVGKQEVEVSMIFALVTNVFGTFVALHLGTPNHRKYPSRAFERVHDYLERRKRYCLTGTL